MLLQYITLITARKIYPFPNNYVLKATFLCILLHNFDFLGFGRYSLVKQITGSFYA